MPNAMPMKRRERGLACAGVIAATVLAAASVHAQVTQPTDLKFSFPNVVIVSQPAAAGATTAAPAQGDGLRAFLDPATGRLTASPSAQQMRDLDAARPAAQRQGFTPKATPAMAVSGVGMQVDESMMMYSVVRRGTDGGLEDACVQGDALAQAFLDGKARPTAHAHNRKATK